MNICFIGGGNMATALIGGLLGKGYVAGQISVVEINAENRAKLQQAFCVQATANWQRAWRAAALSCWR